MNAQRIQFSVKQLLVWTSLFAILLGILTAVGYTIYSVLLSLIAFSLLLLAHEWFRSRSILRSRCYFLATYTLFMAAGTAIALCSPLLIGSYARIPADGFFDAIYKVVRLVHYSYLFIALFLLMSMLSGAFAFWKKRCVRKSAEKSPSSAADAETCITSR